MAVVKLARWRKQAGLSQQEVAAALGCSQPYVSQIERANDPIVPGSDLMSEIYRFTNGQVTPNDFYDLPPLSARAPESLAA